MMGIVIDQWILFVFILMLIYVYLNSINYSIPSQV